MKFQLTLVFVFTFSSAIVGQEQILFDLDTYLRVDGFYRTTFITPQASIDYSNRINNPNEPKRLTADIGGLYQDNRIFNDRKNQKSIYKEIDFNISSGLNDEIVFAFRYDSSNRSYDDSKKYFKNEFSIKTNSKYLHEQNSFNKYQQRIDMSYGLGFGFGRIEIVNNAWIGARLLEELQAKKLLLVTPNAEEMRSFFDLIGDLSFERVMDNRLRSIYQIETIIGYIEQKGWIEKGSIPAFATIYDAFRFEDFILRKSGERLEFTLTPAIIADVIYQYNISGSFARFIEAGFTGCVEYELDKNGDLEYYTTKLLGGKLDYYERFSDNDFNMSDVLAGRIYFEYQYHYLPSRRTNLMFSTNASANFQQTTQFYEAFLSINSTLRYNYYFSPATQLVMTARLLYQDSQFQIGDYQPAISANFSINVIHAIR